jgi:hypothetical protein
MIEEARGIIGIPGRLSTHSAPGVANFPPGDLTTEITETTEIIRF